MDFLGKFLGGSIGLVWLLAGPITFIINVVDTWSTKMSVIGKLAMNLTLDAILAFIWPITWLIWVIQYATGSYDTPLTTVLGF
jgi:hypothetical protein